MKLLLIICICPAPSDKPSTGFPRLSSFHQAHKSSSFQTISALFNFLSLGTNFSLDYFQTSKMSSCCGGCSNAPTERDRCCTTTDSICGAKVTGDYQVKIAGEYGAGKIDGTTGSSNERCCGNSTVDATGRCCNGEPQAPHIEAATNVRIRDLLGQDRDKRMSSTA